MRCGDQDKKEMGLVEVTALDIYREHDFREVTKKDLGRVTE